MEKISKIEIDGVVYSFFDEETSRNLTNISNSHINNIEKQYAVGYSNTEISNNYDWIQVTSPISNRSRSCCYGNGYYVIAGTSGDLAYSTDSINWTKLTPFTSGVITGIAYGNGKFLAVDSNGLLWSCNATPYGEWSNIYTTTIQLEGIRFINDRFFAVGDSGYLAYSIDGVNWQELNSNTTKSLIDITYGQGKYIAIGLDGAMVYSLNAQEWYDNTDLSFTASYRHIAYGKNMFVAGGQNGAMRYSYDGLIWQNGTKNSTATVGWVRGFAYTSGRFYSVIYTSGGAGEVWYSQDGINWEVVYKTSGRLWTICEGDGTFITSGDSGKIYTLDLGIEWVNAKPQGAFDIYYRFILSKNNGNIVYSENYYDGKGSVEIDAYTKAEIDSMFVKKEEGCISAAVLDENGEEVSGSHIYEDGYIITGFSNGGLFTIDAGGGEIYYESPKKGDFYLSSNGISGADTDGHVYEILWKDVAKKADTYTKTEVDEKVAGAGGGVNAEDVMNIIEENSEQTSELDIGTSETFDSESDTQIPTSKAVAGLMASAGGGSKLYSHSLTLTSTNTNAFVNIINNSSEGFTKATLHSFVAAVGEIACSIWGRDDSINNTFKSGGYLMISGVDLQLYHGKFILTIEEENVIKVATRGAFTSILNVSDTVAEITSFIK